MADGIRFLQLSDLHLGGRAWPRCFELSAEQARIRAEELRQSLHRLLELAKQISAEIVLIPGDLFDRESAQNDLVNYVTDVFAALPPVFLAPGNHDYLSPGGPYSEQERSRRGLRPWPDNVCIFREESFVTRYHPQRPDVAVTAQAFRANEPVTEHRLASPLPRDPAEISLLLLHGSRTQFPHEESQKITLPFTAAELLRQKFSYAALGHYHTYSEIADAQGNLRAAYAGRPFHAEFTGDHFGVLSGVATAEGAREVQRHSLDARRLFDLRVLCNNVGSPEELAMLAEQAATDAGAGADDLVRYRFCGTCVPGLRARVSIPSDRHFASAVRVTDLRAGYDMKAMLEAAQGEAASAESLFARALQERLEAATSDAEQDALRDALDYGLRALRGLPLQAPEA